MQLDFGNGIVAGGSSADDYPRIIGHSGLDFPEVEQAMLENAITDGGVLGGARSRMRRMTVALDFGYSTTRAAVAAAFTPGVTRTLDNGTLTIDYVVDSLTFATTNLTQPLRVTVSMVSQDAYPEGDVITATTSDSSVAVFDPSTITGRGKTTFSTSCRAVSRPLTSGRVFAVGEGTNLVAYTDNDGTSWTPVTVTDFVGPGSGVAASGSSVLVVSNSPNLAQAAFYSLNSGSTWALAHGIESNVGCDTDGSGVWISISGAGFLRRTTNLGTVGFTAPTSPTFTSALGIASGRDGSWMAVGGNATNQVISSTDGGATWTGRGRPLGSGGTARACTKVGTRWYIVGNGGSFNGAYSDDNGVTWTGMTLPSGTYHAVRDLEGRLFAVGTVAAYSDDDGATWTAFTSPISTGYAIERIDATMAWFGGADTTDTFASIGAGTRQTVTFTNAAPIPSPGIVTLTFSGTSVNPGFILNGIETRLSGTLANADVVVIDGSTYQVKKNGVVLMSLFDRSTAFPEVVAGSNTLTSESANVSFDIAFAPRYPGML